MNYDKQKTFARVGMVAVLETTATLIMA